MSGGWIAAADDEDVGASGWDMCVIGVLEGDDRSRRDLKDRQYSCSGVSRVVGVVGSFTCGRGRTGAAIAANKAAYSSIDK